MYLEFFFLLLGMFFAIHQVDQIQFYEISEKKTIKIKVKMLVQFFSCRHTDERSADLPVCSPNLR